VLGEAGVRIAVEFASYGGLTRLTDAVALCDRVGWGRCGLLIDTWHFFRTEADWPTLQSLGGDQIALVHINDGLAEVGDDPVRAGRYERLPAGVGTFALSEFVATLGAVGYAGTLSAEVLSDAIRLTPPAESAKLLWPRI
jgi:sugar phosphate isomerase/epimerase